MWIARFVFMTRRSLFRFAGSIVRPPFREQDRIPHLFYQMCSNPHRVFSLGLPPRFRAGVSIAAPRRSPYYNTQTLHKASRGEKTVKVLILSCDTGEGHNSAAAAVAGALTQRGIESHVFDPLVLAGKYAERFVSGAYTTIMKKAPSAFNALYRAGDIYSSTGITSPVYHANARYAANLRAFIETNGYDRVVCTHLYPMETLTAIRKSGDFTVPCYGVLTDYTCIPFLAETDLDGYFIAHEDLRAELVEKGIPSDRIIVTGIPVDEKFAHHMEKAAARNYLAIPQNQDVFLIMSGGIGVGNAGAICDEILRRHSGAFTVYILVGRNSDLKQTLEEKYAGNEHVRIVTFTKKVNVYMNAADVMISKPGGLTSTEAAVAQVPLVQLLVYTACEAPNIAFFSSHGLSERAENAADAAEKAVALVRDKARAEAMREAQRNTIAPDAADKIAERIVLS
ncbi:MAG: glycosyl transferase [Clostridiales bacterium]|nr:glycosyl transferase [Clostridiales bacterium]